MNCIWFVLFLLVEIKAEISTSCPAIKQYDLKPTQIPGTNLSTFTFYQLGLRSFPGGTLSWTQYGSFISNKIFVDNEFNNMKNYKPDHGLYDDSLWYFTPVLECGREGEWYALVNGGTEKAQVTWGPPMHGKHQASYHLIIAKSSIGERNKEDFYIKPEMVKNGVDYYQLKFRKKPLGVVTWSEKKYRDSEAYYIQVDDDVKHRKKYRMGGEWYEDSLFTFRPVEKKVDGVDKIHVEGENCCKLRISLTKIKLKTENLTEKLDNVELISKDYFINNGSAILTKNYEVKKRFLERVKVNKVDGFNGVEDNVEIDSEKHVCYFESVGDVVRKAYEWGYGSGGDANIYIREGERELAFSQSLQVQPCTEYDVTGHVLVVKDLEIEYDVFGKVSGRDGDGAWNLTRIEEMLPADLKYFGEEDNFTMIVKGEGKLLATLALNSVFMGAGKPIPGCVLE